MAINFARKYGWPDVGCERDSSISYDVVNLLSTRSKDVIPWRFEILHLMNDFKCWWSIYTTNLSFCS